MLELFLTLSISSEAIYLLFMFSISTTQCSLASTIFLYCVFCNFWIGCKIKIFVSRPTLIRSILHDTCLTVGSPTSSISTNGYCVFIRRPLIGAWHARTRKFVSLFDTWWPRTPVFNESRQFRVITTVERLSKDGA
jgi:hypothetical protein